MLFNKSEIVKWNKEEKNSCELFGTYNVYTQGHKINDPYSTIGLYHILIGNPVNLGLTLGFCFILRFGSGLGSRGNSKVEMYTPVLLKEVGWVKK